MTAPGDVSGHSTAGTLAAALRLLRRHAPAAFLASVVATAVNTVPDVLRQVLVWDDPRLWAALAVDVVGFLTALVAQLWVTGALAGLLDGGRLTPAGALRRGTALAVRAVRRAPGTVLAGVVTGGAVSALLTLPASIAALGAGRVLGPLDSPDVGAFAVATVSDVVASAATLPYLAFVLVLVATGFRAGRPGTSRA
ncbi:hypothetical protein O2V63_09100 [Modestobacter sp. VKM Ac-2977]|uniref:hypothetical protein n=1 Tax=Modestobacter sp. VKM Ac-2977 TaxID=3004131 RepID=UPI0022AA873A|nr:hypothetical protein [Modestobacter sp. VKM Ac-2977]MCZ2820484.1 hypothetical protein [Modestobacter sp. VKM Ac-2977]